jgi:hypothetical protein
MKLDFMDNDLSYGATFCPQRVVSISKLQTTISSATAGTGNAIYLSEVNDIYIPEDRPHLSIINPLSTSMCKA